MKPVPPESADLVNRLRQQLILAQVRIMELEDERDILAQRQAEIERLLAAAQTLADRKADEVVHLEKILAVTRDRGEQLQHLQQRAGEELAATKHALADTSARLGEREAALADLNRELSAMKATRSWRWTAWLRSLSGRP